MWLGVFFLFFWRNGYYNKNLVLMQISLWTQVEDKNVTNIVIVGDAFAKPMLDALDVAESSEGNHIT